MPGFSRVVRAPFLDAMARRSAGASGSVSRSAEVRDLLLRFCDSLRQYDAFLMAHCIASIGAGHNRWADIPSVRVYSMSFRYVRTRYRLAGRWVVMSAGECA